MHTKIGHTSKVLEYMDQKWIYKSEVETGKVELAYSKLTYT